MKKKMLIDATHEEETRVAVVDENRLIDFDYESKLRKQLKGSVFLAKVTRVEPSLQAAFVNFGGNRHGFLPFSEIHPDYFRIPVSDREALMAEQQAELEKLDAIEQEEEETGEESVDSEVTYEEEEEEGAKESKGDSDHDGANKKPEKTKWRYTRRRSQRQGTPAAGRPRGGRTTRSTQDRLVSRIFLKRCHVMMRHRLGVACRVASGLLLMRSRRKPESL